MFNNFILGLGVQMSLMRKKMVAVDCYHNDAT